MTHRRRGRKNRHRDEVVSLAPIETLAMSVAEAGLVGYPRQLAPLDRSDEVRSVQARPLEGVTTSGERIAEILDAARWPRIHLPPETMR